MSQDVYVLLGLILTPIVFIGVWMLFFFWMKQVEENQCLLGINCMQITAQSH